MSRELPSAFGGPAQYRGSHARVLRTTVASLVAVALIGAVAPVVAPAHADEYTDRDKVNSQIDASNAKLSEENQALTDAVGKAKATRDSLTAAQGTLAAAQRERTAAQAADAVAAEALKTAQDELVKAKADVEQGKKNLATERQTAGNIAMNQYRSQGGALANYAAIASAKTTSQLADRMQWNDEMMAKHNKAMDDLTHAQASYEATEVTKTKAEGNAQTARTNAADALATKQKAETTASQAATALATASKADDAAQATAQKAVDDEKTRLSELNTQRTDVEKRIQERLAREEAARQAAKKAAEEAAAKKAAEDAAAAKRAADDAAAKKAAADQAAKEAAAASAARGDDKPAEAPAAPAAPAVPAVPAPAAAAAASASPFIWPVNGELTSPYGMRLHPVLGYWVLHDGQDFGAGCGAPIRAAAAGTVVENYYDTTGFGNRVLIDHGFLGNTAFTTGYNHAEYYVVSVGQHVEKGDVIGYVGNTGYSTGCHLHLNLWVNGKLTDPMPYLP